MQKPASYNSAFAITPSDSLPVGGECNGIYVGGDNSGTVGDVAVVMGNGGAAVTFKAVPIGTILPVTVKKVKATGTTATLLIGLGTV